MTDLLPEGIRALATQGTGWLLFCFACGAVVWLFRLLQASQATCAQQQRDLSEKRIEEARQTVTAMAAHAQAQIDLVESMRDRTEVLRSLDQNVTQLRRDTDAYQGRWQDRVIGWERSLEEALRRLEELQRGKP